MVDLLFLLSGLINLEDLQISRSKVNDTGISSLKGDYCVLTRSSLLFAPFMLSWRMSYSLPGEKNVSGTILICRIFWSCFWQVFYRFLWKHWCSLCLFFVSTSSRCYCIYWRSKTQKWIVIFYSGPCTGLRKLKKLSMEGCPVTVACMDTIGGKGSYFYRGFSCWLSVRIMGIARLWPFSSLGSHYSRSFMICKSDKCDGQPSYSFLESLVLWIVTAVNDVYLLCRPDFFDLA